MIGAIIGDVVGSRFEFHNHNSKDFELFTPDCRMTDDTIIMVAIAEAILDGSHDFKSYLVKWIRRYPSAGFSRNTLNWAASESHVPNKSFGNGALLRAIPLGLDVVYGGDLGQMVHDVTEAVRCSHDTEQAVDYTLCLSYMLRLLRTRSSFKDAEKAIDVSGYAPRSFDLYRKEGVPFDPTCQATLPVAVACARSAADFEDAIRNAVSVGGDSDTIAAVAGAIAGVYFGVPQKLVDSVRKYLPDDVAEVVDRYCIKRDVLPVPFWADPSLGKVPHDFQFVESGHLFRQPLH